MRTKGVFELEHRVVRVDGTLGWTLSRAVPILGARGEILEWLGTASDVTARKEGEERQAFLLKLSDALRPLADPAAIQGEAARLLALKLDATGCHYSELEGTVWVVEREYPAEPPHMVGRYEMSEGEPATLAALHRGEAIVTDDLARGSNEHERAAASTGIRGAVIVPLVKEGRLRAAFNVRQNEPREWSAAEVALVENVAERTWAAVERARAEAALRESEEKYRTLVENMGDHAVFLLDADGIVTEWTAGARRVKGYAGEEVIGRHVSMFYAPEAVEAGDPERELEEAAREGRAASSGARGNAPWPANWPRTPRPWRGSA